MTAPPAAWQLFERNAAGYEEWYSTPRGRRADLAERALLERLLAPFAAAQSALEVGCGTGHFTRWLAGRLPHVVGLDRAPAMLARRAATIHGCASSRATPPPADPEPGGRSHAVRPHPRIRRRSGGGACGGRADLAAGPARAGAEPLESGRRVTPLGPRCPTTAARPGPRFSASASSAPSPRRGRPAGARSAVGERAVPPRSGQCRASGFLSVTSSASPSSLGPDAPLIHEARQQPRPRQWRRCIPPAPRLGSAARERGERRPDLLQVNEVVLGPVGENLIDSQPSIGPCIPPRGRL